MKGIIISIISALIVIGFLLTPYILDRVYGIISISEMIESKSKIVDFYIFVLSISLFYGMLNILDIFLTWIFS